MGNPIQIARERILQKVMTWAGTKVLIINYHLINKPHLITLIGLLIKYFRCGMNACGLL